MLRLRRPDGSTRTWWRERPRLEEIADIQAEVALPEAAELTSIAPELLATGAIPGVWEAEARVTAFLAIFAGEQAYMVTGEHGVAEPRIVPRAAADVVLAAVRAAVEAGHVCLVNCAATLWKEPVPAGLDLSDATLLPAPIPCRPSGSARRRR